MVKVICDPAKELVILECTRYPSAEALARVIAVVISAGESIILKWANGIVFMYTMLQPTSDNLIAELLKGRIYWTELYYAEMPEYKQTIRISTLDIPIIDVTPNPLLQQATTWLKKQKQQNPNTKNKPKHYNKLNTQDIML